MSTPSIPYDLRGYTADDIRTERISDGTAVHGQYMAYLGNIAMTYAPTPQEARDKTAYYLQHGKWDSVPAQYYADKPRVGGTVLL